jgi:hypothetical protein
MPESPPLSTTRTPMQFVTSFVSNSTVPQCVRKCLAHVFEFFVSLGKALIFSRFSLEGPHSAVLLLEEDGIESPLPSAAVFLTSRAQSRNNRRIYQQTSTT